MICIMENDKWLEFKWHKVNDLKFKAIIIKVS